MRRIPAVGLTALALIVAVGVGLVAYDAGFDAGLTEFADTTADDVVAGEGDTVVRVIDADRRGFAPFGFLFFPLALLFWFLVARFLFWGRWGRPGPWSRGRPDAGGPWPADVEERAADWHRRQHETTPAAWPDESRASTDEA